MNKNTYKRIVELIADTYKLLQLKWDEIEDARIEYEDGFPGFKEAGEKPIEIPVNPTLNNRFVHHLNIEKKVDQWQKDVDDNKKVTIEDEANYLKESVIQTETFKIEIERI